jgi:AraC-like DNA-binding protein
MARTLILRPARLAPFVAAIWYHEGELPPGRERVLPSGHTELMINVVEDEFRTYPGRTGESRRTSGAVIRGPSSRPAVIDTAEQRSVIAVSFQPGGAAAFVPASLSALADQTVDIAELWGSAGSVLREQVLEGGAPEQRLRRVEEVLLERLDVGRVHGDAVLYAAAGLARGVPVGELCRRLGWLPNRFVRTFRNHVGLAPKRFARVRRFQHLLAAAARESQVAWAELAAAHGYYDQAHLIHDFRKFADVSPTSYRPRSPRDRNHVPL